MLFGPERQLATFYIYYILHSTVSETFTSSLQFLEYMTICNVQLPNNNLFCPSPPPPSNPNFHVCVCVFILVFDEFV